jgi:predicted phage terminase large subunit-like protein
MQEKDELKKLEEEIEQAERDLCYRNFYYFIKAAWSIIEPAEFVDNWHVGLIADHLQGQLEGEKSLKNIILNIPPRHSKSTIGSVLYPAYYWLRKPETKIVTVSHTDLLATEFATKSRQLLQHDWFLYWKEIVHIAKNVNTKKKFENNKLGYRLSKSTGSNIIGFGGDLFIVDDPNDISDVYSKAALEKTNQYYKTGLKNRANNAKTAKWLIIQQRLAENDLSGFLLENEEGWFRLNLMAEYEKYYTFKSPIKKNDPREEGEYLDLERFDAEYYEGFKKDPIVWASLYQQRPKAIEGVIVKDSWLVDYNYKPNSFERKILSIDLSKKIKDEHDYTVFNSMGKINNDFFILNIERGKFEFPEIIKLFKTITSKEVFDIILIEEDGNGTSLIQIFKKEYPQIIGVKETEPKESRFYSILPEIMGKRLKFPKTNEEIISLAKEELKSYPKGKNDDIVDTIVMTMRYFLYNNYRGIFNYYEDRKKEFDLFNRKIDKLNEKEIFQQYNKNIFS